MRLFWLEAGAAGLRGRNGQPGVVRYVAGETLDFDQISASYKLAYHEIYCHPISCSRKLLCSCAQERVQARVSFSMIFWAVKMNRPYRSLLDTIFRQAESLFAALPKHSAPILNDRCHPEEGSLRGTTSELCRDDRCGTRTGLSVADPRTPCRERFPEPHQRSKAPAPLRHSASMALTRRPHLSALLWEKHYGHVDHPSPRP
jgi:hypothetical protein